MPFYRAPDTDHAIFASRLKGLATKLGLDQEQVRRIVAAVYAEAKDTGRWSSEGECMTETRKRMIAAAGK